MPLSDGLPAFRKHFVPMFDLHGPALTAENDLSDKFVAAHAVIVHARDEQRGLSDFFARHIENKRFVKDRIESSFFYTRLFLLHFLAIVTHPNLYIWICKESNALFCIEPTKQRKRLICRGFYTVVSNVI